MQLDSRVTMRANSFVFLTKPPNNTTRVSKNILNNGFVPTLELSSYHNHHFDDQQHHPNKNHDEVPINGSSQHGFGHFMATSTSSGPLYGISTPTNSHLAVVPPLLSHNSMVADDHFSCMTTTVSAPAAGGQKELRKRSSSYVVVGHDLKKKKSELMQLVGRYGIRKWSKIAKMLSDRVGKQCRERWFNHLRPDIRV
ncbi:hypothetical protein F8388_021203 [Cannabis sativa]|uniref:Uncharacterized protein n=1 Tax=Cannabis sativa TaxID=3483 RepID=A0A7J6GF50_CANSA|nr:hypothetical protein F8388_021203 [Cannabis sativa]